MEQANKAKRRFLDTDAALAFGQRLGDLRGEKTQDEIASLVGVSRSAWTNYEAGRRLPSAKTIKLFASVVGVPVSAIYDQTKEAEVLEANADGNLPTGRAVIDRLKTAAGCASDSQLAAIINKSQSTISSWANRDTISLEVCVSVANKTGISLDELILGKTPANVTQTGRIDVALFEDCWRVAADLGDTVPSIRQLAVRTYNAVQGGGAVGKSLTIPEIAALLLAADSPA